MKKQNRVLLKISGEALMGSEKFGHDNTIIDQICEDIKEVYDFILHNQDKYFGIGLSTIENIEHTPTWLHLDCRLTGLEEFKIVNP